jgi:hypothetical protein
MNGENALSGAKLVLDLPSSAPCAIAAGNRKRAITKTLNRDCSQNNRQRVSLWVANLTK